jgi:predicted alpha/beta-fold hydrolase
MQVETGPGELETTDLPTVVVQEFLAQARQILNQKPFHPHHFFRGGHAQTIAAYAWPSRRRIAADADEERLFEVAPGVRILAHCRWQPNRGEHPTLVAVHGMEGSSASGYMLWTAKKAFSAGFNVVRVNLRNCGGTEHLTPTLYNAGMSEDIRAVIAELIDQDRLSPLFLAGFSLGGNMVLKLAGEYGANPPPELLAVSAVSPSVDLNLSTKLMSQRRNWIYHQDFVRRMKARVRRKSKLFPELYDANHLRRVRSVREFDECFTAPAGGFDGAEDYYDKCSSIRVVDQIRIPTLIIHAHDDPFIPFAPLTDPVFKSNPYLLLLDTERGGHVAFISRNSSFSEDRFWAENRVIEFCQLRLV